MEMIFPTPSTSICILLKWPEGFFGINNILSLTLQKEVRLLIYLRSHYGMLPKMIQNIGLEKP